MTAETPIDNFEETLVEDNSEEIGSEVEDAYGDEEHLTEYDNDPEEEVVGDDSFWDGNPESLPDELKSVYKNMQSAFTKKMQRASALENKYFESIDAANAAILARQNAQQPVEEVEQEVVPDLSKGASPEEVIQYYVEKATESQVQRRLEALGIKDLAQEMQPVAHRERVTGAYREFASSNPKLDHQKLAPLTGQVIDNDPELSEMAQVNPAAAIRLAARLAQAEMRAAATQQKSRKRRQAAPVAARSGTVVKPRRESMLDAAARALKEAGLNPDSF
tara:strand:+ start:781 stop:1611 length:831 start_codon:yes stop_codon:yes gene_type:complete